MNEDKNPLPRELVKAWKLVAFKRYLKDGTVEDKVEQGANGGLIYFETGRVAVAIKTDKNKTSPDLWYVGEAKQTGDHQVTHWLEQDSTGGKLGQPSVSEVSGRPMNALPRTFTLSADGKHLTLEGPGKGDTQKVALEWEPC